jgi:DHA2 family multidrug resistance protein
MARHTGPAIADLRTYAILNQQLQAQSTLYSYVDGFRFFALICMCCLPIVFLLRPAKAKAGAAPAVH